MSCPAVSVSVPCRPSALLRFVPVPVCLGACALVYALCGADLWAGARAYLCLVLYLLLPGRLLAERLAPDVPGLRPLCALLCGCCLLLVCYLGTMVLHQPLLLHLGPPALWGVLLWRKGGIRRPERVLPALPCHALLLLWAGLCLVSALSFSAVNPHPTAAGAAPLDRDLLWNVGNAEAFCKAFPAQDIRFAGVRFSYHYLTELLTAALSLVSGASCYDLCAFFLPPVWLAGAIAALYWLGLVIYKKKTNSIFIPFVLLCFQCGSLWKVFRTGDSLFGNTMLRHLTSNINAQASATVFFCIFLALFSRLTSGPGSAAYGCGGCVLSPLSCSRWPKGRRLPWPCAPAVPPWSLCCCSAGPGSCPRWSLPPCWPGYLPWYTARCTPPEPTPACSFPSFPCGIP